MYMTPGEREEYALPRIGKLVGNRFKRDSFKFMRDINFIMNGVRKLSGNYSPDVNTFIKVIKQYANVFHNVIDPKCFIEISRNRRDWWKVGENTDKVVFNHFSDSVRSIGDLRVVIFDKIFIRISLDKESILIEIDDSMDKIIDGHSYPATKSYARFTSVKKRIVYVGQQSVAAVTVANTYRGSVQVFQDENSSSFIKDIVYGSSGEISQILISVGGKVKNISELKDLTSDEIFDTFVMKNTANHLTMELIKQFHPEYWGENGRII